ncbi:hypothetical protein CDV55_103243 [Aspergillus turcosus]|uniref:Serine hydrolase domain-containing protein n=1 Tax=Aspergillus turcosus TaxID=1245748 RepID=A0A229XB21_9EURO|nr:hypothetical protein CDV55_103243 [Aspergillus turcosus]RLL96215.1 hypothetical protein CFD26_105216 [Aspergillus turcosus]
MRFLCLHGMGTNSQILQIQLAGIINQLPQHEFFFVDGLEPCPPDPEVKSLWPGGPYLSYYTTPTPEQLEEAYSLVLEVMAEDGPFDGVIGFSQGAALAASMTLQHQKDQPTAAPLFSLGVFLGASLPFDLDSTLAQQSVVASKHQPSGYLGSKDEDDLLILQRYDPRTTSLRIDLPILHVAGKRDPFYQQSELLVGLCSVDSASVIHDGGHFVPKDTHTTARIVRLIEALVGRVQHRC